jgi:hypothetical protein
LSKAEVLICGDSVKNLKSAESGPPETKNLNHTHIFWCSANAFRQISWAVLFISFLMVGCSSFGAQVFLFKSFWLARMGPSQDSAF